MLKYELVEKSKEFINFIKGSKNLTPKKQSKKEGAKDEK